MLTLTAAAATEQNYDENIALSQNETRLSDQEIFDRVASIRAQWSLEERIARRREADRRFENLVEMLADVEVAA